MVITGLVDVVTVPVGAPDVVMRELGFTLPDVPDDIETIGVTRGAGPGGHARSS